MPEPELPPNSDRYLGYMQSSDEEFLDGLLKKVTSKDHILPDDYSRLIGLFVPATQSQTRAKAFLVLSSICEHHRRSSQSSTAEDDPGTHNILHSFSQSVERRLADVDEVPIFEALSFVAALFAVDWRSASAIFVRDGFQDSMMDSLELYPSNTVFQSVISSILSSACGYKSCQQSLDPRCSAWLETTFHHTSDVKLKASTSLALLKLSQALGAEGTNVGGATTDSTQGDERRAELFKAMRDIVVNSTDNIRDISDAVESLAYLSTVPAFKARIVDDHELLKRMVSFGTSLRRNTDDDYGTTPFGLAVFVSNLCSYRPRLTEEQAQIERLKRIAQPKAPDANARTDKDSTSGQELDDDEHVRLRCKVLVTAGVTELLTVIARITDSAATRMVVGKALLGLVKDKDNRGKILQAGAARTLMTLIRASQLPPDAESASPLAKLGMEFTDLLSVQALAKLAITASPMQVFGPNENVTVEAIRPFVCLLLHSSSSLLQKFEAIMALTNIASSTPDLADRIAHTEAVLSKLEFLLLDENQLVRRAATELICNLVSGSELAFNRFSGDASESESSSTLNQSKSCLHVLIALADVDDEPTRLASSGALAVLSGSPTACKLIMLLEFEHHRVFPVLKQLIDPSSDSEGENQPATVQSNPGLVHRGVVCVRNVFTNLSDDTLRRKLASEAVSHGIVDALANVIKGAGQGNGTEAILRPTAEALKWLMDSGVNVLS